VIFAEIVIVFSRECVCECLPYLFVSRTVFPQHLLQPSDEHTPTTTTEWSCNDQATRIDTRDNNGVKLHEAADELEAGKLERAS